MNGSILDVANAILDFLDDSSRIPRFIEWLTLNKNVSIINYDDPDLKKELYRKIVLFENNNIGH
jgi:hypothetical protein